MKTKEVIEYIVGWLKSYADDHKMKGFVTGVSGGIDSAVTSTLCALTGRELLCLSLPIHQHRFELERGQEHINWLQKKFPSVLKAEIELTQTFESFSSALPAEIRDNLTMANSRSRLRMTTLYAFASHYKLLVAGTGNKIEDFGIGFFTKYGDGGVDISPIADLMKSEVYAIAKELDIVQSIQNAKPTDGLFADARSDEDQIGASYDELEWAMQFIDSREPITNLSAREKEVLNIFQHRNRVNLHKIKSIPVCIIPNNLK